MPDRTGLRYGHPGCGHTVGPSAPVDGRVKEADATKPVREPTPAERKEPPCLEVERAAGSELAGCLTQGRAARIRADGEVDSLRFGFPDDADAGLAQRFGQPRRAEADGGARRT
jgi:hypothetical protein